MIPRTFDHLPITALLLLAGVSCAALVPDDDNDSGVSVAISPASITNIDAGTITIAYEPPLSGIATAALGTWAESVSALKVTIEPVAAVYDDRQQAFVAVNLWVPKNGYVVVDTLRMPAEDAGILLTIQWTPEQQDAMEQMLVDLRANLRCCSASLAIPDGARFEIDGHYVAPDPQETQVVVGWPSAQQQAMSQSFAAMLETVRSYHIVRADAEAKPPALVRWYAPGADNDDGLLVLVVLGDGTAAWRVDPADAPPDTVCHTRDGATRTVRDLVAAYGTAPFDDDDR